MGESSHGPSGYTTPAAMAGVALVGASPLLIAASSVVIDHEVNELVAGVAVLCVGLYALALAALAHAVRVSRSVGHPGAAAVAAVVASAPGVACWVALAVYTSAQAHSSAGFWVAALMAAPLALLLYGYVPDLVRRNAAFAASGAFKGLPFPSNPALRVIGCVDSRVDPSDVLGLELGEAVVMRNVGGPVTPEALRSWALLGRLGAGQSPGGGHLAILQHTDCGIRRLASFPEQLAAFFEIPVADLAGKAVEDPHASVRIDVDLARRRLPGLRVSGWVYDVDTGLVEVVAG